jgi:hypothetical protein
VVTQHGIDGPRAEGLSEEIVQERLSVGVRIEYTVKWKRETSVYSTYARESWLSGSCDTKSPVYMLNEKPVSSVPVSGGMACIAATVRDSGVSLVLN